MAEVPAPGIPADQVLAQSPPANASQVAAPKISLLTTAPPQPQAFVMPSFVGQPLGSANRTLTDAGFKLGNVSVAAPPPVAVDPANPTATPAPAQVVVPEEASPASIIVSQQPAAGQKVFAGTAVNFEVR
jgi:beta-lactam-binding protein with PASTA domain